MPSTFQVSQCYIWGFWHAWQTWPSPWWRRMTGFGIFNGSPHGSGRCCLFHQFSKCQGCSSLPSQRGYNARREWLLRSFGIQKRQQGLFLGYRPLYLQTFGYHTPTYRIIDRWCTAPKNGYLLLDTVHDTTSAILRHPLSPLCLTKITENQALNVRCFDISVTNAKVKWKDTFAAFAPANTPSSRSMLHSNDPALTVLFYAFLL